MGTATGDTDDVARQERLSGGVRAGDGTWVVVPTYYERENLARFVHTVLAEVPGAHVLVVDESRPSTTCR